MKLGTSKHSMPDDIVLYHLRLISRGPVDQRPTRSSSTCFRNILAFIVLDGQYKGGMNEKIPIVIKIARKLSVRCGQIVHLVQQGQVSAFLGLFPEAPSLHNAYFVCPSRSHQKKVHQKRCIVVRRKRKMKIYDWHTYEVQHI